MGLGTSTQTTSNNSPWAAPLGNLGVSLRNVGLPLIQQLGSQYAEALRTGGVNSFIPWITRALDTSRSAGSKSLDDLRQQLARMGMGGTSEAAAISQRAEQSNNMQTALTPEEMIQQFIGGAPAFALNTTGQALKGFGAAGNLQNTSTTTSTPSFWDQFNQGLNTASNFFQPH